MKQIRLLSYLLPLLYLMYGCGSAEAIECYSYPVRKSKLEKAVTKVIYDNPNIRVDHSTQRQRDSILWANKSQWSSEDSVNYYNDLQSTIDVYIKVDTSEYYYLFRYRGTRPYWETSEISAIFIQVARDNKGNAFYQGNNEHGEFSSKLAKDLTNVFKKEIVNNIDKELHLQHSNDCDY